MHWWPALVSGLLYGWVIDPVDFVDLTPDTLRADYRADYILMVAEAYQSENDLDLAARRLAIFGSDPPAEIVVAGASIRNFRRILRHQS